MQQEEDRGPGRRPGPDGDRVIGDRTGSRRRRGAALHRNPIDHGVGQKRPEQDHGAHFAVHQKMRKRPDLNRRQHRVLDRRSDLALRQIARHQHDQLFNIDVTDINESPTELSLSNSTVTEGEAGQLVGLFDIIDPDQNDTHTYELTTGNGSDDNLHFQIRNGNELATASALAFADQTSYTIRIRVTDSGGLFMEQAFVISVLEDPILGFEPDPQLIDGMYPNPSRDYVQIDLTTENYPFDLKMYDYHGKLKTATTDIFSSSITLDVRNMSNGIYIVMVKDKNGGITRKKLMVAR